MMNQTENCGLYVTDNDKTPFLEWRKKMNGTENSNMVKIDSALVAKANHSISVQTTLTATQWTGNESPFIQEITVDGLGQNQNGYIAVAQNATVEQRLMAREAMFSVIGQRENVLVIGADGELPDIDVPVEIILLD